MAGSMDKLVTEIEIVRKEAPAEYSAFLRKAYGTEAFLKFPMRWSWIYNQNPYASGRRIGLTTIKVNGALAGQSGAIAANILLASKTIPAHWSVDTVILPEFRGLGLGKALQKANSEQSQIFLSLSMSKKNRGIKRGLKQIELSPMFVYEKYIQFKPHEIESNIFFRWKYKKVIRNFFLFLRYFGIFYFFCIIRNIWISISQRFSHFQNSGLKATNLQFIPWNDEYLSAWDSALNSTLHKLPFQILRTSEYLRWRYLQEPMLLGSYNLYFLKSAEKLIGLVVFRKRSPNEDSGYLLIDYCILEHDEDVFSQIMDFFQMKAKSEGVGRLIIGTSNSQHSSFLKSLGYVAYKEYRGMAGSLNPELQGMLGNLGDVFFTLGDHDIDQFMPRKAF